MLGMAIAIVLFVLLYQRKVIQSQFEIEKINRHRQQELLNASIKSEETERKRIASELHDDIGASLSAIKLHLYAIPGKNEHIANLLDETIKKVRSISHRLQPAILERLGLEKALRSFAQSWNTDVIHITAQNKGTPVDLNKESQLGVYRIIQELVANIVKHGQAKRILIESIHDDITLRVVLRHDGLGLSQEEFESLVYKEGATGLKNITNRLLLLGAHIAFSLSETEELKYQVTLKIVKKN
jgi:signal transduction histidine kinase